MLSPLQLIKRTFKLACVIFLLALSTNPIISQEDGTECPYFTILGGDAENLNFALTSTDVSATISGVIANVEVTQTYVNDGEDVLDAVYIFPMSSNAAIYAMQMQIGDRIVVAEIK